MAAHRTGRSKRGGHAYKADPDDRAATESACGMCGRCCHFDVPLDLEDIARLASHLGRARSAIFATCVQSEMAADSGAMLLQKQNGTQACIFLTEENRCGVYAGRPTACVSYVCPPLAISV